MPWNHCGKGIADDQRCPACGMSKPAWTMKHDQTRTFMLSGEYDGDAAAQTDTLQRASDSGAPFCQECADAARDGQGDGD